MADIWTPISGYTPQDYTDTAVFEVDSETKKIALITGQALVAGEKDSQYISFLMPRYWDGIDISSKTFTIEYALAGTYYGTSEAVNAEMTSEQVRFGWIVPETACAISGTLLFVLKITGEDYVLKTQIAEHPVFKTINVEDVVPEPTKEAWYREFEARVEVAIADAETAIEQAQTAQAAAEAAAQNAQTAEDNAEAAAAMAQTRYGSPLVAQTAEEMVEQNRVYVYTGSETGYTAGHWYYYDGTAWTSGGVYNGTAINTDTTLTQSGMAADAKKTGDEISQIKEDLTSVSSRFEPLEPIIVNMYDYFWANGRTALSKRISTDADAKNLYLIVSGNEGASVVTVDAESPLTFANLNTTPMAGIIEYSDGVDLISLYVSNGTLTVYPPLKETITGVKIYSLAVGIHLTEAGYKYYANCLYNTDRRYTRKNKAIAQYNAYIDYNPATSGITKIGSYWWGKGVRNIANESFRVIMNGCNEYLNCSLITGATASSPKGFEWEQNIAGKSGYFEMYIGGKDSAPMVAEFENGYEFHFEWYLDGVLVDSYTKKTKRFEAVRFNFNNAQTGKIKFYVTAGQSGYEAWITQMTWWETDETNGKIFSDYKVPCLLMDSWGVYHDNAFQTRLVELLTENNGLPSYVINKSLGSTTSEWGLNNFYSRAWIEHPDYIISDFQINDVNTSVTQETFVANMKKLIDASIGSWIVPVLIMQGYNTTAGTYSPYTFPFLAALANLT